MARIGMGKNIAALTRSENRALAVSDRAREIISAAIRKLVVLYFSKSFCLRWFGNFHNPSRFRSVVDTKQTTVTCCEDENSDMGKERL